jgi:hypothetical protein
MARGGATVTLSDAQQHHPSFDLRSASRWADPCAKGNTCYHAECGCPLAALAPELARADHAMKAPIRGKLIKYKNRMLPLMPGRRVADKERAFFSIFSTMIGQLQSPEYYQIKRHERECSRAHEIFSCAASKGP